MEELYDRNNETVRRQYDETRYKGGMANSKIKTCPKIA